MKEQEALDQRFKQKWGLEMKKIVYKENSAALEPERLWNSSFLGTFERTQQGSVKLKITQVGCWNASLLNLLVFLAGKPQIISQICWAVSTSSIQFTYHFCTVHLPKLFRSSAGWCGQTRKSTCAYEGTLPRSAQGRAATMQALTAAVSPERPSEITGAGRKIYCPKLGFIHHRRNTNRGLMKISPVGRKLFTYPSASSQCAPLLTLRWHVSNGRAEGTDVPSAGSWEAGWTPIQMPLELGFWGFFPFKWGEVENKCHQLQEHT